MAQKHCSNCFYGQLEIEQEPCNSCIRQAPDIAFSKWIDRNIYIKEEEMEVTNEEEDVFKQMKEWLVKQSVGIKEDTSTMGTTAGSKEWGVKFDSGKPQWSLLPFEALEEVVEVLTSGAKKYAPNNWKYVPDADDRYMDAAFRHITAYMQGNKYDNETGNNHLAHAVCCLLFKLWFDRKHELDEIYAPF
jgi:hypothetical protein